MVFRDTIKFSTASEIFLKIKHRAVMQVVTHKLAYKTSQPRNWYTDVNNETMSM